MQKAIIIEDEARSRELLHDLVTANCPEVEVVAQSGTIDEAVMLIRAHQPHLLFLDIELQTGTGFEILQQVADLSPAVRSEEHTSELQSLMRISYAVFCLKKNNKEKPINSHLKNKA